MLIATAKEGDEAMDDFTKGDLRALAGPRSFERGLGYLDAVTGLEVGDGWITATVHGTDTYEVHLSLDGPASITGECDCPYGLDGNFCKHLVAEGLTVLGRPEGLPGSAPGPRPAPRAWRHGWPHFRGRNC